MDDDNIELAVIEGRNNINYESYCGETYSMWVLENSRFKVGGPIKYGQNLRLKHLSSGNYLAFKIRENEDDGNNFYLSR